MCDEITENETQEYLKAQVENGTNLVTRRTVNMMVGGIGMSALFAGCTTGESLDTVTENDVEIDTPDGKANAYFVHPSSGKHPAIIIWPDVMSLRPAFKMMGKRLAMAGYSVLVINPYYRTTKNLVTSEGESFGNPEVRARIMPHRRALSTQTNTTDAKAFVAFLDAQDAVDTSRKIGTSGYCMGGPMTMITAAAVPERIGAGASFHGGGLASDKENSPHLRVPEMKAGFLFAVAENDDDRDPEAKNLLRKAYDDAGLFAEIEVYKGAKHGWCPPDSRVYNEAQAERAWSRMLALFEQELA